MKKHKKSSGKSQVTASVPLDDKAEAEKQQDAKEASTSHKSDVKTDRNRLFHSAQAGNQTVNVNVTIEQPKDDDCTTSCFASIAKCFGKGAA